MHHREGLSRSLKRLARRSLRPGRRLNPVSTKHAGLPVYGAAAATLPGAPGYRAACKMVEQSKWLKG